MKRGCLLLYILLAPVLVVAQASKLAPELQQPSGMRAVPVIVQYRNGLPTTQPGVIGVRNGQVLAQLGVINGVTATVPTDSLAALAADPRVAYISPDRVVRGHMNNAAPAVMANYAWGLRLDGTRIGVALIDSGVHAVDDLATPSGGSRVSASLDYTGEGTDDYYGHGTHVAGSIGGNGADSTCPICNVTIKGIAPNVNLISFKVLDSQGLGSESAVIQAIQAAIQMKATYNIRVMNLSLGRPVFESYKQDPLCQAVEQAWKAGIVVVVSAGNGGRDNSAGTAGYGTVESPGNDPYVITVGATNTKGTPGRTDDVMTSYSAKGPTAIDHIVKPDLVAPGNRIVSLAAPGWLEATYPQNLAPLSYYQSVGSADASSNYFVLSGTSMAAGMVSGITLVCVTGISVLLLELARGPWTFPRMFAIYLVATVVASSLKVELPGVNGTLSINLIVNLLAVVELSPAEALVVGCASAVCQSLWRKHRVEAIHVLFNLAQMALTVEVAQAIFHQSAKLLGPNLPIRVLASATAYFLVNTLPVAEVIALSEKRQFGKTWSEFYLWSFSNYLVGGVLVCVVAWSNANLGWQASAMMVPVGYLLYRSYRLYLGKLEEEKKHVEQMASLHLRTIEALALAIDAKDHATHDHLQRVRVFAVEVGQEMGLADGDLEALRAASLLHDIGKLAVPEHIINKPGKLTPEEFDKMKIHPIVGGEILERVNFPYPVVPIVRSHHERWDGKGYPDGLCGEEIPVGARILAAVDCLDALASDRQYRRALPLQEAMAVVAAGSGTQFDARVIEVLQRRYEELESKARTLCERPESRKLSTNVKVKNGHAPAAGFESTKPVERKQDFLASIVAARREAQTLLEFSSDVGRSLSLHETLSLVATRVGKLVPYNAAAIYLIRDSKLIPEYVIGDDFRVFAMLEIPMGEGLTGWVAQNRRPILNGNPAVESGYLNGSVACSCLSSALAVPLVRGEDEVLGVLALYKSEADAFSADHLRILLAMSEKIAASISNAIKYKAAADSAKVDFLTGLPNARSLFHHLDAEIARCARERSKLAAILCDLNGFKALNDRFGHLAGNKVLEAFATKLRSVCREYDFISRMGGDEFVLVTPGMSRKAVEEICARINAAAAESAREVCPGALLSASAGAAIFPDDAPDAEQLLVEADKRMYARKKLQQRPAEPEEMPLLAAAAQ